MRPGLGEGEESARKGRERGRGPVRGRKVVPQAPRRRPRTMEGGGHGRRLFDCSKEARMAETTREKQWTKKTTLMLQMKMKMKMQMKMKNRTDGTRKADIFSR
jgi:hypothetical protein